MTCVKLAKILITWKVESKAESPVNNNSKVLNFSQKLLCGMILSALNVISKKSQAQELQINGAVT